MAWQWSQDALNLIIKPCRCSQYLSMFSSNFELFGHLDILHFGICREAMRSAMEVVAEAHGGFTRLYMYNVQHDDFAQMVKVAVSVYC